MWAVNNIVADDKVVQPVTAKNHSFHLHWYTSFVNVRKYDVIAADNIPFHTTFLKYIMMKMQSSGGTEDKKVVQECWWTK